MPFNSRMLWSRMPAPTCWRHWASMQISSYCFIHTHTSGPHGGNQTTRDLPCPHLHPKEPVFIHIAQSDAWVYLGHLLNASLHGKNKGLSALQNTREGRIMFSMSDVLYRRTGESNFHKGINGKSNGNKLTCSVMMSYKTNSEKCSFLNRKLLDSYEEITCIMTKVL